MSLFVDAIHDLNIPAASSHFASRFHNLNPNYQALLLSVDGSVVRFMRHVLLIVGFVQ
jgi:hypothetical protein